MKVALLQAQWRWHQEFVNVKTSEDCLGQRIAHVPGHLSNVRIFQGRALIYIPHSIKADQLFL